MDHVWLSDDFFLAMICHYKDKNTSLPEASVKLLHLKKKVSPAPVKGSQKRSLKGGQIGACRCEHVFSFMDSSNTLGRPMENIEMLLNKHNQTKTSTNCSENLKHTGICNFICASLIMDERYFWRFASSSCSTCMPSFLMSVYLWTNVPHFMTVIVLINFLKSKSWQQIKPNLLVTCKHLKAVSSQLSSSTTEGVAPPA